MHLELREIVDEHVKGFREPLSENLLLDLSLSSGTESKEENPQTISFQNLPQLSKKVPRWKSICSIACFTCYKYDLTLCARCYILGTYRVGINSSDFQLAEIIEESKTMWSDKETEMLLEVVMHYGDDWKEVVSHVTGRTEKDVAALAAVTALSDVGYANQQVTRKELWLARKL